MVFVNEFVSNEDVVKSGLREVWRRYHPHADIEDFQYSWTINRDDDVFFIPARSGREEDSNRKNVYYILKILNLKLF